MRIQHMQTSIQNCINYRGNNRQKLGYASSQVHTYQNDILTEDYCIVSYINPPTGVNRLYKSY